MYVCIYIRLDRSVDGLFLLLCVSGFPLIAGDLTDLSLLFKFLFVHQKAEDNT